jgi:hypothetical protein
MSAPAKFLPDGSSRNLLLEAFVYLQVLDVISTLVGFSLGDTEASPFIRMLIRWGPVAGLVASKLVAVAILLFCVFLKRWKLIRFVNYWYAGLVIWNLYIVWKVLNS